MFGWLVHGYESGAQFNLPELLADQPWDLTLDYVTDATSPTPTETVIALHYPPTNATCKIHFDESNACFPMLVESFWASGERFLRYEVTAFETVETDLGPVVIPTEVVQETSGSQPPSGSRQVARIDAATLKVNQPIPHSKFVVPRELAKRIFDLDAQTMYDVAQDKVFPVPPIDDERPRTPAVPLESRGSVRWLLWMNVLVLGALAGVLLRRRTRCNVSRAPR
jgi:hypothetical protein